MGQVCNLPGDSVPGRLQTCPTLPVTSTPQFLNHARKRLRGSLGNPAWCGVFPFVPACRKSYI